MKNILIGLVLLFSLTHIVLAQAKYEKVVKHAADRLEQSIKISSREFNKNVLFGPNILDDCYYYRIDPKKDSYGSRSLASLRGALNHWFDNNLPIAGREIHFYQSLCHKKISANLLVPENELRLVNLSSFAGRVTYGDSAGLIFTVKHFPGGDASLEFSEESQVVFNYSLAELASDNNYLFNELLKANKIYKPKAIMITHAAYPRASAELAKIFPELVGLFPNFLNLPATFSPLIIKGLLRKIYGFEGLIIADWFDMKSIKTFVAENRTLLPAEYRSLSDHELTAVAGIYAGINWLSTFSTRALLGLERLYLTDAYFRKAFDQLALETMFIKLKITPLSSNPRPMVLSGFPLAIMSTDRNKLTSTEQAIVDTIRRLLTGKTEHESFLLKLTTISKPSAGSVPEIRGSVVADLMKYYSRHDETWHRGGLLVMEFRKNILEEMSGQKFPDLFENDKNGTLWLKLLFTNKTFAKLYKNMDWQSKDLQKAYEKVLGQRINLMK